jgi:NADH-quinone oxidoreductase subunit L
MSQSMISLLPLTFILPFLGFLILATVRDRLSENMAAIIGVGNMAVSALVALLAGQEFLQQPAAAGHAVAVHQVLWTWMQVGSFAPAFGLHLDGLSLTMTGIITGIGFLIHLFASWYMRGDATYARFFSYMNLFVASMLLLVLGDNLVLLYLGWEGVGICSYLLIGYYYSDLANGRAAIKAFTVTRVGDVFLALGMFMIFKELGTLNIQEILHRAPELLASGNIQLIALLILGGAMGKSAQIPLHTWLADAMAGPTPVSALIHAATMVTAGVYLIARLHPIFLEAPNVLDFVGQVGAAGVLISGFSALAQTDIKRVLAYSTMGQIGYMFLALGVGAWQASIFHLMAHAFFKALLFLSSGAVILACHHEQNIFKMGGLWRKIPFVYACFLVGGGALVALPFVTVGFYSKDPILWQAWASGHHGVFWAGLFGAFLTSVYTFRLILIVFHGQENGHSEPIKGVTYWLPLSILLVLSTFVGSMIHPPLAGVLPDFKALAAFENDEHFVEIISIATALGGLLVGFFLFSGQRTLVKKFNQTRIGAGLGYCMYNAFGFDALFDRLFTRPFFAIARLVKADPVDKFWSIVPAIVRGGNAWSTQGQKGQLRGYLASTAFGAVILLFALLAIQVMGK